MKNLIFFLFILSYFSISCFGAVGYVGQMFPLSGTVTQGANYTIYIQVYKAGVTEGGGQGTGINCQIYYSSVSAFGGSWGVASTIDMTYNVDKGNNDEYQGSLIPSSGGLYEYTCRCSDDNGANWTFRNAGAEGGNGRLTVNGPLAVSWAALRATRNNENISISWSTVSEINNSHFEILQSLNGIDWQPIAIISSKGKDNGTAYSKKVKANQALEYYYKIKQVDLDGEESFSNIVFVPLGNHNHQIQIYPNPVCDALIISRKSNFLSIEIYNQLGNRVYHNTSWSDNSIDVSLLNSGLYVIIVTDESGNRTKKVISKI